MKKTIFAILAGEYSFVEFLRFADLSLCKSPIDRLFEATKVALTTFAGKTYVVLTEEIAKKVKTNLLAANFIITDQQTEDGHLVLQTDKSLIATKEFLEALLATT
ncbi:MAG: hypothetical protein ACOZAO_05210 [Patescibacteria group bacterium]